MNIIIPVVSILEIVGIKLAMLLINCIVSRVFSKILKMIDARIILIIKTTRNFEACS